MPNKHRYSSSAWKPQQPDGIFSEQEIGDVARDLTKLLGLPVSNEEAANYLHGMSRLFAILARIDKRTGGRVGVKGGD